jgi:hypothetical protein
MWQKRNGTPFLGLASLAAAGRDQAWALTGQATDAHYIRLLAAGGRGQTLRPWLQGGQRQAVWKAFASDTHNLLYTGMAAAATALVLPPPPPVARELQVRETSEPQLFRLAQCPSHHAKGTPGAGCWSGWLAGWHAARCRRGCPAKPPGE